MVPQWVWWVIWFVFGSCIGSFLNVCIYRMPREQSIVHPSSRCPQCGQPIAWHDNIPLLSFAWLRAVCRHCRHPISWRYPIVEALSGCATVVVLHRFGAGAVGVASLALVYALIAASFIDLEFQIIPDEISLGGLAVGVILSVVFPILHDTGSRLVSVERSAVGLLVGGGVLYLTGSAGNVMLLGLRRLGIALRRRPFWRRRLARYRHMREAMGGGDVKLLAMAGSILGWKPVLLTFFLAPILALIPGLLVMGFKRTHVIPYGPFLSLGLVISMLFGNDLLRASGVEETVQLLWTYYGWR